MIAVLCPTRGRPKSFARMVESVLTKSRTANVYAYVDNDDHCLPYYEAQKSLGVMIEVGERIGPVAAANALAGRHPDHDFYGLITDDAVVEGQQWDEYLMEVLDKLPARLGVISPSHNYGPHVDMPFVTESWIREMGWFAYPHCYHFAWPTITGLLAERAGCLIRAPRHKFSVCHEQEATYPFEQTTDDALALYKFMLHDYERLGDRLKEIVADG